MNYNKKPNFKVLALVAFIILLNILIVVFAFIGRGDLVITFLGFNFVFLVIAYFILLARKRSENSERIDDENDDTD